MGQHHIEDQVEMCEGVADVADAVPVCLQRLGATCAVPVGAGEAQHAAEKAFEGPGFCKPCAIGASG